MRVLEKIESVCPACYQEGKIQKIDASVIEEDEQVWIAKKCKKHGSFKDIYFGDVNLYRRWMKFKVTGDTVSDVKTSLFGDPELYLEHKSQTVLTTLMVTNRGNLRCNNCINNAETESYIYEPTLDQIQELMLQARDEKPIGSKAIQITGGEPTVRDDVFDIVRIAKTVGFSHVQVYTNGLKLAESIEYCQRLKDEKVNTVYMSFNGVTEKTNPCIEQNRKAIENLRRVNLNVVLVPVLVGDENIYEAGKIVRFALDNTDIVKGVNFQPISFCLNLTKISDDTRKSQKVDCVRVMEVIEKEFNGQISRDDFYPFSFVFPLSKMIEILKKETQVEVSAHPGCGGSTFIFINKGRPIPITRFIDVEAFLSFLTRQSEGCE